MKRQSSSKSIDFNNLSSKTISPKNSNKDQTQLTNNKSRNDDFQLKNRVRTTSGAKQKTKRKTGARPLTNSSLSKIDASISKQSRETGSRQNGTAN